MNTGIFCYNCNKFTETIEPIILKRFAVDKIKIIGVCKKCLIGKCHEYVETDYCHLPKFIYSIPVGILYINRFAVRGEASNELRSSELCSNNVYTQRDLNLKVMLNEFINGRSVTIPTT